MTNFGQELFNLGLAVSLVQARELPRPEPVNEDADAIKEQGGCALTDSSESI